MPKFYTAYNYPGGRSEPKCPRVIPEYGVDATDKIIITSQIDFYERIQSHADSCRLDRKIQQYTMGNSLALGVPGGQYGDFSAQPSDLAQVLNSKQEGQRAFEQLSDSIRGLFGNSYTAFAESLQNGTYQGIIEKYAAEQLAKLGAGAGVPANQITEGGAE